MICMLFSVMLCLQLPADSVAPAARGGGNAPLDAVPSVDLKRYCGTWYEIARLPNRFQKKCSGNVMATYSLRDDGTIRVINRCRTGEGDITEAEGVARKADDDGPDSKLKVRFAPAFLSILPWVWGDYWIIQLAPDYSYAVVGEPDHQYCWILARTPTLDEPVLQSVFDRLRAQGYDPGALVRTPQSW